MRGDDKSDPENAGETFLSADSLWPGPLLQLRQVRFHRHRRGPLTTLMHRRINRPCRRQT
jgi:hypothetical protein